MAIDAAEEISSYLGKDGKPYVPVEEFEKFEKLNKFLDTLFTKEFHARKKPLALKFKQVQAQVEEPKTKSQVTSDLTNTKLEILSILQALEFADYSESAKRKAVEKLSSKINELSKKKLTEDTVLKLGIYAFTLEIIKRGELDRANEIKKL